MATAKTKPETIMSLKPTQVQAIGRAWIAADEEYGNAGGVLAKAVCEAGSKFMERGSVANALDGKALAAHVGKARNWAEPTRKVRASQCVALLNARATLPKIIDRIAEEFGACAWNLAYTAAKAIVKGEDPMKAVRKARKVHDTQRGGGKPEDSGEAKKSVAMRVKKILDMPHLGKKFKDDLRALCKAHRINLGNA